MNYVILEDCSPYFIRYRHEGDTHVFNMAKKFQTALMSKWQTMKHMVPYHNRMPVEDGIKTLEHVYGADRLNFQKERVSLFVTKPKSYYRPHRDGINLNWGINYNIEILDECCITNWYDSSNFEQRPHTTVNGQYRSREVVDFDFIEYKNLVPLKSMTAKEGEVVLFNTDIYHDVNNMQSDNFRTILTLRTLSFETTFDQVKKTLFA